MPYTKNPYDYSNPYDLNSKQGMTAVWVMDAFIVCPERVALDALMKSEVHYLKNILNPKP